MWHYGGGAGLPGRVPNSLSVNVANNVLQAFERRGVACTQQPLLGDRFIPKYCFMPGARIPPACLGVTRSGNLAALADFWVLAVLGPLMRERKGGRPSARGQRHCFYYNFSRSVPPCCKTAGSSYGVRGMCRSLSLAPFGYNPVNTELCVKPTELNGNSPEFWRVRLLGELPCSQSGGKEGFFPTH